MSSDEVIALATDALRGQLLSVLPVDATVVEGGVTGRASGIGIVRTFGAYVGEVGYPSPSWGCSWL